ncbi:hypothetical protein L3Q82_008546, partial [Scortum barcoo]
SQTQGLGTSLKILFSERQIEALSTSSVQRPSFQLSRQEIVSLLNAFGRDNCLFMKCPAGFPPASES